MKELINLLIQKNLTISSAESFTGGFFGSEITSIPNASKVFLGGIIVYSNQAKTNILKVSKQTIKKYGVISKQCAQEMAQNSNKFFKSDIAVSFTGNAGPTSMEGKEVGLGYIGISFLNKNIVIKMNEKNLSREEFRIKAIKIFLINAKEIIEKI